MTHPECCSLCGSGDAEDTAWGWLCFWCFDEEVSDEDKGPKEAEEDGEEEGC